VNVARAFNLQFLPNGGYREPTEAGSGNLPKTMAFPQTRRLAQQAFYFQPPPSAL
jgi:hypothetical protein